MTKNNCWKISMHHFQPRRLFFGSVCVCLWSVYTVLVQRVYNVGRSLDPVNIACTQNTVWRPSQRPVKWWPIFWAIFDYPGFIKIGSKEASFPFDFNEGSVADRRLLIYTLLLRALRQTEQDPAVASHSSAHTHTTHTSTSMLHKLFHYS